LLRACRNACIDEEEDSEGPFINDKGVTITDEMIELAFRQYKDSTGEFSKIEVTTKKTIIGESKLSARKGGAFDANDLHGKEYFIVLDKKRMNVKANDLYSYLQWKQFSTITEGDSVYYVIDGLNLNQAVALDNHLKNDGVNTRSIGKRNVTADGDVVVVKASAEDIKNETKKGLEIPKIPTSDEIIYRIQIGAYNRPQDRKRFLGIADVVEFQGNDGVYRYFSGPHANIRNAAKQRIIMTSEQGFKDAFIVAFKDGRRISLKEVTEVNPDYDEMIDEFENSITGKRAFVYTIQVAAYKELPKDLFDLFLTLDEKLDSQPGDDGVIRYTIGSYTSEGEARVALDNLKAEGIDDAFVLIKSHGELIELKDAQDIINDK